MKAGSGYEVFRYSSDVDKAQAQGRVAYLDTSDGAKIAAIAKSFQRKGHEPGKFAYPAMNNWISNAREPELGYMIQQKYISSEDRGRRTKEADALIDKLIRSGYTAFYASSKLSRYEGKFTGSKEPEEQILLMVAAKKA